MIYPQKSTSRAAVVFAIALILAAASTVEAKEWQAWVGAQSRDLGSQALAFLPNELWVHTGDSVRWNLTSTEIHTVTFLKPGQTRPPNFGPTFSVPVGCPGNTPDGASFDESTCVNAGILGQDGNIGTGLETYSVTFPAAGNFKFVCLVHLDMTGTVHVLNASETLPYDQTSYNTQAWNEGAQLVSEASGLTSRAISENVNEMHVARVTAGVGAIVTKGAGSQTESLSRFLRQRIVVQVGDTVEWTNFDPSTPHTVTFGDEPPDPRAPSQNVSLTSEGARQAIIGSPDDTANSGLLLLALQDRPMLSQSPLGVSRFRVTFTSPGTFNYKCSLHDSIGMKGTVVVR